MIKITFFKTLRINFVEFNPNPKITQHDPLDCTVRSLCCMEGLSWDESFDIFAKAAKKLGYAHFGRYQVINKVLKKFDFIDIEEQFPTNANHNVAYVMDNYRNSNLIITTYSHATVYKKGSMYDIIIPDQDIDGFISDNIYGVWAKKDDPDPRIKKMVKKQKKMIKKEKKGKKNG